MNPAQQYGPASHAVVSDDAPSRSVTLQSVTGYNLRLDVFTEEPPSWFWRLVADANALLQLPPDRGRTGRGVCPEREDNAPVSHT